MGGKPLLSIDRIFCVPLLGPFGLPRHLFEVPRMAFAHRARGRARTRRVDARRERRRRGTGHLVILAGESVRAPRSSSDGRARRHRDADGRTGTER